MKGFKCDCCDLNWDWIEDGRLDNIPLFTPVSVNSRIPVLLSLSRWQPNCYKLWRHHLVGALFPCSELLSSECWSKRWCPDSLLGFIVPFGTSRPVSKPLHLLDIQVMSWACPWLRTPGYLFLVLVMPLLNSGIYERACADRPSLGMSLTLMLSA